MDAAPVKFLGELCDVWCTLTVLGAVVAMNPTLTHARDPAWVFERQARVAVRVDPFQRAADRLINAKYEAWYPRIGCSNGSLELRILDRPNETPKFDGTWWYAPLDGRQSLALALHASFVAKADGSGQYCWKPSVSTNCSLYALVGPAISDPLPLEGKCRLLGLLEAEFEINVAVPARAVEEVALRLGSTTTGTHEWSKGEFGHWENGTWVPEGDLKKIHAAAILASVSGTDLPPPPDPTSWSPISGPSQVIVIDAATVTAALGSPFLPFDNLAPAVREVSAGVPIWSDVDLGISLRKGFFLTMPDGRTGPIGSLFPIRIWGEQSVSQGGKTYTVSYEFFVAAPTVTWIESEQQISLKLAILQPSVRLTNVSLVSKQRASSVCSAIGEIRLDLPQVDPSSGALQIPVRKFEVQLESCFGSGKLVIDPRYLDRLLGKLLPTTLQLETSVNLSLPPCIQVSDKAVTAKFSCPNGQTGCYASLMTPEKNSVLKLDLPHIKFRLSDDELQIGVPIIVSPAN